VVIAAHDQLRIDGAILVRSVGRGTQRPGRLLPLLEELLGDLLAQLMIGLLPGLTGAEAHFNGVVAGASDRRRLGVSPTEGQQTDSQEQ